MKNRQSISAAVSASLIISIVIALMAILTAACDRADESTRPNSPNWKKGQWQLIGELQHDVYYESLCFTDEKNGWVVGWSGRILHTDDGGYSWQLQDSGTSANLQWVHFADEKEAGQEVTITRLDAQPTVAALGLGTIQKASLTGYSRQPLS